MLPRKNTRTAGAVPAGHVGHQGRRMKGIDAPAGEHQQGAEHEGAEVDRMRQDMAHLPDWMHLGKGARYDGQDPSGDEEYGHAEPREEEERGMPFKPAGEQQAQRHAALAGVDAAEIVGIGAGGAEEGDAAGLQFLDLEEGQDHAELHQAEGDIGEVHAFAAIRGDVGEVADVGEVQEIVAGPAEQVVMQAGGEEQVGPALARGDR